MSCVTFHRYYPVPWETKLCDGTVRLLVGRYANANPEAGSVILVDSGYERWYLAVDYRPRPENTTLSVADITLDLDSANYELSTSAIEMNAYQVRTISNNWERLVYGGWSRIIMGPISLPADYRSDFKVDFNLLVEGGSFAGSVDTCHLSLNVIYSKEREFYWGR